MDFAGTGVPLSVERLADACDRLRVRLPEIWAVLKVETSGCGFLADRRPQILFERHVFHHETLGRFDVTAPEVSDDHPGGYGAGGAHQYDRLQQAIALDRSAALRSASWGIGQVMGRNAQIVGFTDIETMVREMMVSEDTQLDAMLGYVVATGLDRAMQQRDWTAFARGYNGKNFAENAYDQKLHDAFVGYFSNGTPDVRIRAGQMHLRYAGFDPGPIDGAFGNRTRDALRQFQTARGLPSSGSFDDGTMAALAERTASS
jgi:N-acetylmuramidase/Putative peptidoglycan binding domain